MLDLHRYSVDSGDISLVAATRKTAIQLITGTTRILMPLELKLSVPSSTSTDRPVLVELREQSTAGTANAATINNLVPQFPAAIFTARNGFTVEPTDVGLVSDVPVRLTAVGGLLVYTYDFDIVMPISKRWAFCLTAPDAVSNVRLGIKVRE